jgi:predicted Rossmann fold nucleotide-binding protein DprA/Smf involved in DNA uptake
MIVSVTAHRDLSVKDVEVIRKTMTDLVRDPLVRAIHFGGARGGDTEALKAALSARVNERSSIPKLVVIVPDTVACQPAEARKWIAKADEVIELKETISRSDGYASYTNRDHYLVEVCDKLVAFCRSDADTGGTLKTIRIAIFQGKEVMTVTLPGD